jgi:hypothetical protein
MDQEGAPGETNKIESCENPTQSEDTNKLAENAPFTANANQLTNESNSNLPEKETVIDSVKQKVDDDLLACESAAQPHVEQLPEQEQDKPAVQFEAESQQQQQQQKEQPQLLEPEQEQKCQHEETQISNQTNELKMDDKEEAPTANLEQKENVQVNNLELETGEGEARRGEEAPNEEVNMEKNLEEELTTTTTATTTIGTSGDAIHNDNDTRPDDTHLQETISSAHNEDNTMGNDLEELQSENQETTNLSQPNMPQSPETTTSNTADTENSDAVAAVVAAVEQAVAAKAAAAANGEIQPASANPVKPAAAASSSSGGGGNKKKPANRQPTSAGSGGPTTPNKANSSINLNDSLNSLSASQKRRKRDPHAPKAPLNGYLVFFNEERAELRLKNPVISFGELTKIIATKWKELSADEKQKYVNEAELDKERYNKEMADYKLSDAFKHKEATTTAGSQAKIARTNADEGVASSGGHAHPSYQGADTPNLSWLQNESNIAGFDIPIFTEEFIDHSKSREQEIRQLRKEVNELEQQNSVLNKHIESLKHSSNKIDSDLDQYKSVNGQIQKNLDIFRQTMLHCFSSTPLPNTQECAQASNIDDYIMKMYAIVNNINLNDQQQHHHHQQLNNDPNYAINRNFAMHVKSIFSKINFTSLFDNV